MPLYCGLVATVDREKDDQAALSVVAVDIKCQVRGWLAALTASITYRNHLNARAKWCEFCFPINEDIAICRFEATVNGSRLKAACLQQAEFPQRTRNDNYTPAEVFRIPIGALERDQTAVITLGLVMPLLRDPVQGDVIVEIPSTFNPCFVELAPNEYYLDPNKMKERVLSIFDDFVAVTPSKYDVALRCRIQLGVNSQIARVTLRPYEGVPNKINAIFGKSDLTAVVLATLRDYGEDVDDNLQIVITPKDRLSPAVIVTEPGLIGSKELDWAKNHLVGVWYEPTAERPGAVHRGAHLLTQSGRLASDEYWFVQDCSGSMDDFFNGLKKIEEARSTLMLLIKNLPPESKFNVITFGTNYDCLFPDGAVDSDAKENREKAKQYAIRMAANMTTTSIAGPLEHILNAPKLKRGAERFILLITDGTFDEPDDQVKELVQQLGSNSHIYAVGIGNAVSQKMLNDLATMTNGDVDFLTSENDRLSNRVVAMMEAAGKKQAASNVRLTWNADKIIRSVPEKVPEVTFYGKPMFQMVEVAASGREIKGSATITASRRVVIQEGNNLPASIPVSSLQAVPDDNVPLDFSIGPLEFSMPVHMAPLHYYAAHLWMRQVDSSAASSTSLDCAKHTVETSTESGVLSRHTLYCLQDESGNAAKSNRGRWLVSHFEETIACERPKETMILVTRKPKSANLNDESDEPATAVELSRMVAYVLVAKRDPVEITNEFYLAGRTLEALIGLHQDDGKWLLDDRLAKQATGKQQQVDGQVDQVREAVRKIILETVAPQTRDQLASSDAVIGTLIGLAIISRRFADCQYDWLFDEASALEFLLHGKLLDHNSIDQLRKRIAKEVVIA